MAEFVEAGGHYVFDPASNTVKTVLICTDASGKPVSEVRYITTVQIFLAWAANMRAVEQEIYGHMGRENVVAMSDYRAHADTA